MKVSAIDSSITSFKAQPLRPQVVNSVKNEVKDTVSFSAGKASQGLGAFKSIAGVAAALLAATFLLTSGLQNKDKKEN